MYLSSRLVFTFVLIFLLGACAATQRTDVAAPQVDAQKLSSDLRVVEQLATGMARLDEELRAFRETGKWGERGFFDAEETRQVEALLYRFTTYHTALSELVASYGSPVESLATSELEARAHILSAYATLLLTSHTALLVTEFAGDAIAIKQLNQAYFRSEIPFGTYDNAREAVTDPDLFEAVRRDRALYEQALADPQSQLSGIGDSDPGSARLRQALPALLSQTEARLAAVARAYPSHTSSELVAAEDDIGQHKTLYFVRSVLFKDVSRLKSPAAHLITFSDVQKHQVYAALEPGDLVLTYTAGYMSSVFIPGAFKHGITYIGMPEQRQAMALTPGELGEEAAYRTDTLADNLQRMTLENGKQADVIEAVAEGVIFNNLGHIMDTHINRMLVLRPRLSEAERRAFLLEIFSYLGDGYDFRFDFSDATFQVCTEVIYRALDGKGGIRFELTERAGHATLSADDIVNYYLSGHPPAFDVVLFAEEDPASASHRARVLVGEPAIKRVGTLMSGQQ